MKSKRLFVWFIVSFFTSCLTVAMASEDQFGNARKLVKIERYDQAKELIEGVIINDPENPENLFRGALLYYEMGRLKEAQRNMEFAAIIGGDEYRKKGADIFQAEAFSAIKANKEKALRMFEMALSIAPDQKSAITEKLMKTGKDNLQNDQHEAAHNCFTIARSLDLNLAGQISDLYYAQGENPQAPFMLLFQRAREFSSKNNPHIAERLKSYYDRTDISEKTKAALKQEIKIYATKAQFDKFFPPPPKDIVHYDPGSHVIFLAAGQTTNHSITFPARKQNYNYSVSSEDDNFIITFADGDSYLVKNLKTLPHKNPVKFTLTARDTDQKIKLIVK